MAAQAADETAFSARQVPAESESGVFDWFTQAFPKGSDPVVKDSFAFGDYRYFFVLTDHEQFPFIPVLMKHQQDGRWLRDADAEWMQLRPITQAIQGAYRVAYHSSNTDGFQNSPDEGEYIELPVDEKTGSSHPVFLRMQQFCVTSENVNTESTVTSEQLEQAEPCSESAQAAIEFMRKAWQVFNDKDIETYLGMLEPLVRQLASQSSEESLAAKIAAYAEFELTITSVYSTDAYALVFYALRDTRFPGSDGNGVKVTQSRRLPRDADGNYQLGTDGTSDALSELLELPEVEEYMRSKGYIRE